MDDAQAAALATLTGQMFAEPIATGEVVVTDEPAPATLATAPPTLPAPPEPAAPPTFTADPPAVAEPVAPPESVPTFKPKLDEDLQALLDEPDFDEEARLEVAAEVGEDEYAYEDPEVAARERAKDKRIQFLETQLVAKSKRGWVEEAKRAFPDLALLPGEIEGIAATSRRAFIREANTRNERYKTILAPVFEKVAAERAALASGAVEIAREEVANAWGKAASDVLPQLAAASQEALEKARATGGLEGAIKELMKSTPVL